MTLLRPDLVPGRSDGLALAGQTLSWDTSLGLRVHVTSDTPVLDTCVSKIHVYLMILTLTMMKDATHWVRLCWTLSSRVWILPMKVCLFEQVTAIPSINLRNLEHHNESVDHLSCRARFVDKTVVYCYSLMFVKDNKLSNSITKAARLRIGFQKYFGFKIIWGVNEEQFASIWWCCHETDI